MPLPPKSVPTQRKSPDPDPQKQPAELVPAKNAPHIFLMYLRNYLRIVRKTP